VVKPVLPIKTENIWTAAAKQEEGSLDNGFFEQSNPLALECIYWALIHHRTNPIFFASHIDDMFGTQMWRYQIAILICSFPITNSALL
jgi:hypothetical protein